MAYAVPPATPSDPSWTPTPRRLEALDLMSRGFTYGQAADLMGLGEDTVKYHIACVRQQLGVRSTAHAVAIACQRGWFANL